MHKRHDEIVRYYDECEIDYRLMWCLSRAYAMHYGYWDASVHGLTAALQRMNEILAECAGIRPEDHVLDAGCGIGGSALYLARKYGCRVTGVTLSHRQARRAREHATRNGFSGRVDFVIGDFDALPFEDASFDLVWALESVCYANDKRRFVREAHRVLRDGRRLVVADGFAARDDLDPVDAQALHEWLICWGVESLDSPAKFTDHAEQAGFSGCRFRDITAQVMPTVRRLFRGSLYAMTITNVLEFLGLRSRTQTLNVVGCRRQYRIFRNGIARYGVFIADKPKRQLATSEPAR